MYGEIRPPSPPLPDPGVLENPTDGPPVPSCRPKSSLMNIPLHFLRAKPLSRFRLSRTGTAEVGTDLDLLETSVVAPKKAPLLGLPLELRNAIYQYLLVHDRPLGFEETSCLLDELGWDSARKFKGRIYLQLLKVCRQLYIESSAFFYGKNTFGLRIYEHWANQPRNHLFPPPLLQELQLKSVPIFKVRRFDIVVVLETEERYWRTRYMVRKTCLMLAKNPNLQVLNVRLAASKKLSSHHLCVDTRLILEPFAMLRGIQLATFGNTTLVDSLAPISLGERFVTFSKFSLDFVRLQGILSAIRTEPSTFYLRPCIRCEFWQDRNNVSSREYTWTTEIVSPDYAKYLKDKVEGDSPPVNSLPEDFEALMTRTKDFVRLPLYHNKDRMIQAFIAMEENDMDRYFQLKEKILEDFQDYWDSR